MPYKTQSPDTSPEAERVLIEGYRRMSVAEKLDCVFSFRESLMALQLDDIRRRHPDADEHRQRMYLASRWLPAAAMRAAFGWDPDVEGY